MELPRPGIVVALLTPFGADGEVDRDALRAHAEWLVAAGVDALMPAGTTGEGALLDEDELLAVVEETFGAAGGRVPVIAHVGRPSTRATVRLARRALAAGADAVAAVTPYFHAPSPDGLRRHYAALREAAGDAPTLAYTIPSHAHVHVAPETVAALARDGLAGLKDSTADAELHAAYLAAAPDLAVYVGATDLVGASRRAGSAGAILAIANLHPRLARAVLGEDVGAAQAQLSAAGAVLHRAEARIPALKRAVADALAAEGVRYPTATRTLDAPSPAPTPAPS